MIGKNNTYFRQCRQYCLKRLPSFQSKPVTLQTRAIICAFSSWKYLHKKDEKTFAKAIDIKLRIGTKFTASQLHSFTASQLHSFTAEGSLCPNKFTNNHTRIFSTQNASGKIYVPEAFFIYKTVKSARKLD